MSELEVIDFEAEARRLAELQNRPDVRERLAKLEAEDAEQERKRLAEEAEKPFAALSACGVPRRIVDILRGHKDTHATRRIDKWVEERKTNSSRWCLVLSATKGLGKSVAAGLWMLRSGAHPITRGNYSEGYTAMHTWWPISRFARMEGYDGKFDAVCEHPGPVVIDDIGSEYLDSKGWFLQAFDAFIDARYSEYRPTLLTTNLSAGDFKKRYSERVIDRIREGGSYFEFRGESMRGAV